MTSVPDGYARAQGEADLQQLGDVLAEAFAFPAGDSPTWLARAGHENARVFRQGGAVAGGLLLVPMGQFWGGRSVRLGGFSAVGVAAHARGSGVATRMMEESLRELRREGFPLAGLYPATQPLYRRVGFEQAGARYEIRGPVSALPEGSHELPVRRFAAEDLPALQRLYAGVARARTGWLDRGPYVWSRIQEPRGHTAHGYVVMDEAGEPEGYTFLARVMKPSFKHDLLLTDLIARSPRGWRRLLTFLRDHGSLAQEVVWFGGADEPLLLPLREQTLAARVYNWWMLRLLDVPAALEARGYPLGLSATLHLEVTEDALFPDNAGRWVLEVSGGEGRVRRGGDGDVRGDVRALASLYSGYRSAVDLAGLGVVSATMRGQETAEAIFGGRAPSMRDQF